MNECLSPEQWGILADPDAADETKTELLGHAVRCGECATMLGLFEVVPRAFSIEEGGPRAGARWTRALGGMAAAALFGLAVLAVWLVLSVERDPVLEGEYWASSEGAPAKKPLPSGRRLQAGAKGVAVGTPEGLWIAFGAHSTFRWNGELEFEVERGEAECFVPGSFSKDPLRFRVPGGWVQASDAHFEVVAMKHAAQALFLTVMTGTISFAADSGRTGEFGRGESLRISTEGEWVLHQSQDEGPADGDIQELLVKLESADPAVRANARQALRARGPGILPALEKALRESRDPSVREQLSSVIKQVEDDREAEFMRLVVEVTTVRRTIEEGARATGLEDVYRSDCKLRTRDIPDAAKLKELLRLDDATVEKIREAFAMVEKTRRDSEARIDAILARWKNPGDDPIQWKEFIAQDHPVLAREWGREKDLPSQLIEAIKKCLDEDKRKALDRELEELLAEKIYRQILPRIRSFYAGDPPNHEGLGARTLLGMGKGILPGLRKARVDERFPLEDRVRLDPILRALEK